MEVDAAQNLFVALGRRARAEPFQVAFADAAQTAQRPKYSPGEAVGKQASQPARHAPQGARHGQNQPVLEVLPHR